jgi:hypothetical protein
MAITSAGFSIVTMTRAASWIFSHVAPTSNTLMPSMRRRHT